MILAFSLSALSWLIVPTTWRVNDGDNGPGYAVLALSIGWVILVVCAFKWYGKRAWKILLLPPGWLWHFFIFALLAYACAFAHDCI